MTQKRYYVCTLIIGIMSMGLCASYHMDPSSYQRIVQRVEEVRLCHEAFEGNLQEVKRLVEEDKIPLTCKDRDGWTPLLSAVFGAKLNVTAGREPDSNVDVVGYLLLQGASTKRYNVDRSWFTSPLEQVVAPKQLVALCALLLAAGANGLEKSGRGKCSTVLELAQSVEQYNLTYHLKHPYNKDFARDYSASKKIRRMAEKATNDFCSLDLRNYKTTMAFVGWRQLHLNT